MTSQLKLVNVAVDFPVRHLYTYIVPDDLKAKIGEGSRVMVPFGKRELTGYVVSFADNEAAVKEFNLDHIKAVSSVIDELPIVNNNLIALCRWVSDYYIAPPGFVYKCAYPAGTNIVSRMEVCINPEGQDNKSTLSTNEKYLLSTLKADGKTTVAALNSKLNIKDIYPLVARLKAKNLIITSSRFSHPKISEKHESIVRLKSTGSIFTNEEERIRLTGKQLQFIKMLTEYGETELKEACKRCKVQSATVKKLAEKGLIEISSRRVFRSPRMEHDPDYVNAHELIPAQTSAVKTITEAISANCSKVFLLHGITGSGKTEIYIRLIENVINSGKTALVLVPEISLTPQILSRFHARFPGKVAVLHSALSSGERLDEWYRLSEGAASIAIGTRSAVFAPLKNLGLIVVDEEHDPSYKQEESPCYNGRDIAIKRGEIESCPVVLGSASPSVESFYKAQRGEYIYLHLPDRATGSQLPSVEIIDMRKKRKSLISEELEERIRSAAENREQVILFLNRRGFYRIFHCTECGMVLMCPNCSVSLVHHLPDNMIRCHYCNYSVNVPATCSFCGKNAMKGIGLGVQMLEEEVKSKFPELRIQRFDKDSTRKKNSFSNILSAFKAGTIDILLGTQMLSKGHDYPRVTLTGIILADQEINFPDFRSNERAFQTLLQVSGRSGRRELPGKSIIQSYKPEHYVLQALKEHDYKCFFEKEIEFREKLGYPPFSHLINIVFSGKEREETRRLSEKFSNILLLEKTRGDVLIIGPAEPLRWKVRGKYRWQVIVKSQERLSGVESVKRALNKFPLSMRNIGIFIDVDPVNLI